MTVKLTKAKVFNLKKKCQNLMNRIDVTIKSLAQKVGLIVATFLGVQLGKLYYRRCDNCKQESLKTVKDLNWWVNHIESVDRQILLPDSSIILRANASNGGWAQWVSRRGGEKTPWEETGQI